MKILLALLLLTLIPAIAYATGPGPTPSQTTVNVSPSLSSSPSVTGGATTQENTTRAFGVGGTGLTSTAPCLGSLSILFGLGAGTSIEKGCVLRHYAAQCKDEACRHKMRCADPDLIDEGKEALGCKLK